MDTQHQNTPETLPLFPLDTGMDASGSTGRVVDRSLDRSLDRDAGRDVDRSSGQNSGKKSGANRKSGDSRKSRDNKKTDTRTPVGQRIQPRKSRSRSDRGQHSVNPHLVEARKLSRKIKYLPDHSEAQTETAQAICQHLRLLLAAAESAD